MVSSNRNIKAVWMLYHSSLHWGYHTTRWCTDGGLLKSPLPLINAWYYKGSDSAEINQTLIRCQDQTLNKWMDWCHERLKGKTWGQTCTMMNANSSVHLFLSLHWGWQHYMVVSWCQYTQTAITVTTWWRQPTMMHSNVQVGPQQWSLCNQWQHTD